MEKENKNKKERSSREVFGILNEENDFQNDNNEVFTP